jgi:hypothetical protein
MNTYHYRSSSLRISSVTLVFPLPEEYVPLPEKLQKMITTLNRRKK